MNRKKIRKFYTEILMRCTDRWGPDCAGISIVFLKVCDCNGRLILCSYCKEIINMNTLVPYEIANEKGQTHCTYKQGDLPVPAMWVRTSWRALQNTIEELQVWADTWLSKLETFKYPGFCGKCTNWLGSVGCDICKLKDERPTGFNEPQERLSLSEDPSPW